MKIGILSLFFVVCIGLPANAQELLHYWNFNEGAGEAGTSWPSPIAPNVTTGDATIVHELADGTIQNFSGTTLNAQDGDPAGGSFSVQAGPSNVNNGRHFDLVIPSRGYGGVFIEYATRGTATGFKTHTVSVSTDGTTFTDFSTIAANTTATWSVSTIDLTSIPEAEDNADLVVRITLDGGTTDAGNNRFDNIAVWGYTPDDNRPPFFTTVLDNRSIDAETPFSFQFEAADPDGDPLTFSLQNAPNGASIGADSGLFTWTPTLAQGDRAWTITTRVTDGELTAETSAQLYVVAFPDNTPPIFTASLPDTLVRVGDELVYTFEAQDVDGDELTLELVAAPQGVTFDEVTGEFAWTVTTPGAYRVVVSVTDGMATVEHDAVVGVRGLLYPGLDGADLREQLRAHYLPSQVLSYDDARDSMYAVLDLEPDGFVRGVYSGFGVRLEGDGTPRSIMSSGGIDAEHTWPQSRGAGAGMPRSDLHHLFPTRAAVNSARGNLPFASIPAEEVIRWYRDNTSVTTTPADVGTYSRLGTQAFQPRDVHLGPAARSIVYFFAAYEDVVDMLFFTRQMETVAQWAEMEIPSASEIRRTYTISTWQGNTNPFIFDSTLAARIIVDVEHPEVMPIGEARQLGDGSTVLIEGVVTRARGRYSRIQDDTGALNIFQAFGSLYSAIERGDVAEGDLLRVAGTMGSFNELRQISSLALFEVISRENELPDPALITLDEIARNGEAYESMLVQIDDIRIDASGTFSASTTYDLLDSDGAPSDVDLRIQQAQDSELVGQPIPEGRLTFTGVLGRYLESFQLDAVRITDFQPYVDTSVEELPAERFAVSPVYPNPTSGTALLHVSSGSPQHVRAELFDALGRRVLLMHDGMLNGGETMPLSINAADLSSGLYLIRITSDEGVKQQTVVVVR